MKKKCWTVLLPGHGHCGKSRQTVVDAMKTKSIRAWMISLLCPFGNPLFWSFLGYVVAREGKSNFFSVGQLWKRDRGKGSAIYRNWYEGGRWMEVGQRCKRYKRLGE
jgi:hypothetical protein